MNGSVKADAATPGGGHATRCEMGDAVSDTQGFEGEMVLGEPVNVGAPEGTGTLTARFVRYDGCQQLTLWLPQDGYTGYRRLRIRDASGAAIEDSELTSRLNGRVQIVTDTFGWPPGHYAVEITNADGWSHELRLEKLEAGIAPPQPEPTLPEPRETPIVYRDGFGNILPDLDLAMRAKELARLTARFSRRLEFEGNFRAGTIFYIEGDIRLPFYHEMCGGGVHFSIDLPTEAKWEAETGRPLADRRDIVEFVAAETQRRRARSWNYVILDDRIDFTD